MVKIPCAALKQLVILCLLGNQSLCPWHDGWPSILELFKNRGSGWVHWVDTNIVRSVGPKLYGRRSTYPSVSDQQRVRSFGVEVTHKLSFVPGFSRKITSNVPKSRKSRRRVPFIGHSVLQRFRCRLREKPVRRDGVQVLPNIFWTSNLSLQYGEGGRKKNKNKKVTILKKSVGSCIFRLLLQNLKTRLSRPLPSSLLFRMICSNASKPFSILFLRLLLRGSRLRNPWVQALKYPHYS